MSLPTYSEDVPAPVPITPSRDEDGARHIPVLTRMDSRVLAGSSGFCYEREEEPEVQLAQDGIGGSLHRQMTRNSQREPAERHPNDFNRTPIKEQSQDRSDTSETISTSGDQLETNYGKEIVAVQDLGRRKSNSDSESDNDDKKPIDLGDGKVAMGKDARTGKYVVIDKRYIEGGPYCKPKW